MKLLFVVHAAPWAESSGTPLITGQYAQRALERGWEVAFLTPDTPANRAPPPPAYAGVQRLFWPALKDWHLNAFSAPPLARQGPQAVIDFKPDIVHIVDWVLIDSSVLPALRALGAPIVRQVWNFEDICTLIEPIHRFPAGQPCPAPLTARDCAECLLNRRQIQLQVGNHNFRELTTRLADYGDSFIRAQTGPIERRKTVAADHFSTFYDKVIFPTRSFLDYFSSHLPLSGDHEIVEHGIAVRDAVTDKPRHDSVNVIYVGGNAKRKGWGALVKAFSRLYDEGVTNVNLRIYGSRAITSQSHLARYPNVEFRDPYNMDTMVEEFAWADVGVAPTQFETFCRIVREFMLCGVVPVASRAFGIPEVVEHDRNGILLDEPTGDDLYAALLDLSRNPEKITRLKAGCAATSIPSPESEFDHLSAIYESLRTTRARQN